MPDAVVRPVSGAQVGEILEVASEFSIPVTTRGAGSSLTGGATPIGGGWVLDLSGLDSIEIDEGNMLANCGPGAVVEDLQKKASAVGLFYPPDPSSKKFCTIGGNIACNAGGLRCVKYGVTRDYVLALAGFLATGEFVRWGRATRKFATGYNLRDLWVGARHPRGSDRGNLEADSPTRGKKDLSRRLFRRSLACRLLRLDEDGVRPSIIEFLDQWTVDCVQQYTGKDVFPGLASHAVLLIELDGTESSINAQSEKLLAWLGQNSVRSCVAESGEEEETLWEVRRQASPAMKKLAETKLNEDVVVPLDRQIELVDFVSSLREDTSLKIGVFGHCGDGNLRQLYVRRE